MSTSIWRLKISWEAGALNKELLEQFAVNISDSESDNDKADEGVNEDFLDGDSTTFGSRSESSSSLDDI